MIDIPFDEIGPSKVILIHSGKAGLDAIVVIDNTSLGPSIGGVRVSPSVTVKEVARLARTMTLKNSISGLPHGGGKAGILADPRAPSKEHLFRIFAREIRELTDYIPGPDMGSDEECMAWVFDEINRAVGLPEVIGGIPLDTLGATGFGLASCAEVACAHAGIALKGARVAIQGYGSVGRAAARYLSDKGAMLVAASDTKGTIHGEDGIDQKELFEIKRATGSVVNYRKRKAKAVEDIFSVDCDILVPAATPDVIDAGNAASIKARIILQGANIPATTEAERILHKRGVLSIPDFIANAGGVIMAAMEYAKRSEHEAFEAIDERITRNTGLVLERSKAEGVLPRQAAVEIAQERVLEAMRYREY